MSRMWAVAARELRSQLVSPVAWSVGAGFLLLTGFFFFNLITDYAALLQQYGLYAQIYQNPALMEQVNLNEIVVGGMFRNMLVILLFMMPVLTMRSFAEERRQGTDELLLTAPVTPGQLVTGKFLGLGILTVALMLAAGSYQMVLLWYGDPELGPIWTALLGLILMGLALASLGLAVSTATESQVVAGVGSFVLFLMLFVIDWPAERVGGPGGAVLKALSLPAHFESFSQGLVTGSDVVYYLSLVALGLVVARSIVASQRWR